MTLRELLDGMESYGLDRDSPVVQALLEGSGEDRMLSLAEFVEVFTADNRSFAPRSLLATTLDA